VPLCSPSALLSLCVVPSLSYQPKLPSLTFLASVCSSLGYPSHTARPDDVPDVGCSFSLYLATNTERHRVTPSLFPPTTTTLALSLFLCMNGLWLPQAPTILSLLFVLILLCFCSLRPPHQPASPGRTPEPPPHRFTLHRHRSSLSHAFTLSRFRTPSHTFTLPICHEGPSPRRRRTRLRPVRAAAAHRMVLARYVLNLTSSPTPLRSIPPYTPFQF
jgi:hypothetical protein